MQEKQTLQLESLVRYSLFFTAPFNLLTGFFFAFPDSVMGHLLELPQSSHPFYSYMSGSIIALFGLVYVWLALQPIIVRSVLLIGTSGKLIAVLISFGLTISGDLSPIVATAIAGDLLFVGLWIYYLMQTQKPEGLVAE